MFLRVFVGAIAGLAAWALLEPTAPKSLAEAAWDSWEIQFLAALGLLIGSGIGGVNGFLTGGKLHILRGFLLGALFGVVGIMVGSKLGVLISGLAVGPDWAVSGNIMRMIVGRVLALTPIGALLGLAIGASTLSLKRAYHGLIGGAIGGGIGAGIFDFVGQLIGAAMLAAKGIPEGGRTEVGGLSRALFAIALGAGIAIFISIVENMAKSAWVRMRLGRNEGREWPIYGVTTTLGRSEAATIPIFGDPTVQPFHAAIVQQAGAYIIVDNGGGVILNGQPVSQAALASGSAIQMGQTVLEFVMKEGAAAYRAADMAGYRGHPMHQSQVAAASQSAPMAQTYAPTQAVQPNSGQTVAQPAQAFPTLVALDGPLIGQRFPVMQPLDLGRESTVIPMSFDSLASRRHASVLPAAGGLSVQDLGSTNGVYVNGQRVQSALIPSGGTLKIGATTFRVE